MNKISNKPKVLVDMDGVLAQFDADVTQEYESARDLKISRALIP